MGEVIAATLIGIIILTILSLIVVAIGRVFEIDFIEAFLFTIVFLAISFYIGIRFV